MAARVAVNNDDMFNYLHRLFMKRHELRTRRFFEKWEEQSGRWKDETLNSDVCDPQSPPQEPMKLPILTASAFNLTPASETANLAYYALLASVEESKGEYQGAIRLLPQSWRAVYTTYWLQCEVDNGGHDQFFQNSKGILNEETAADLQFIGATKYAKIFEDASKAYANQREHDVKTGRFPILDEMDELFYQQPQSLFELLGQYIQAHPEAYIN